MSNDILVSRNALKSMISLGRARAAMSRTRVRDIVRSRLRLDEIEALAWLDGEVIDAPALERKYGSASRGIEQWFLPFVQMFGRTDELTGAWSADGILDWLRIRRIYSPEDERYFRMDAIESVQPQVERWLDACGETGADLEYLRAMEATRLWVQAAPLARGNRSVGAMLADVRVFGPAMSHGGVLAIGMRQADMPLALWARSARDPQQMWWKSIDHAARHVEETERRVSGYLSRVDFLLTGKRNAERLHAVCRLALLENWVTAQLVERQLVVAQSVSQRLVLQAVSLGLLREMTGNGRFRGYRATM